MNRIILGVGTIAFAGAVVIGATGAFFSDTETSTGNTFTAGNIDLQIDNESFAVDYNIPGFQGPVGHFVYNPNTSWALQDLVPGRDHFFNFSDLKPGDQGEDTISIHVGSNNAWMCAAARLDSNSDNTCTEPESADDPGCGTSDPLANGDLAQNLNFAFWRDDGDNVYESNDVQGAVTTGTSDAVNPFLQGPLSGLGAQGQITLADSQSSILGGNSPIPGNSTFYIGKVWCYGTLTPTPVAQDGLGNTYISGPGTGTNGPNLRTTGWSCNGVPINNAGQTDSVTGDMQFYAVQSRNNSSFTCSQYTPVWPQS